MIHDPFPGPKDGQWPPDYVAIFAWRQRRLQMLRSDKVFLASALAYYEKHPVEFIEHWCSTYDPRNAGSGKLTTLPFILFPRQRELVQFLQACILAEANGLIEKCRDMGATWLCCAFSVWAWRFVDGAAIGWGSRKEQLVDKLGDADSIFEKIRILIRRLPREFLPAGFNGDDHMPFMRILNPQNGASITGEAGDNIGRGGRKLLYIKDESAHYERPEKIEAALSETTRVQIDISSVNGIGNVFHRKREAGVEWSKWRFPERYKTNVFVMDWSDHPEKTPEWYQARRAKFQDDGLLHIFAQEIDRDYAASIEGVVIRPEWVNAAIDADIALGFDDEGRTFAGLDVGGDEVTSDKHALTIRKGPCCLLSEHWGKLDTGATARKAIAMCKPFGSLELEYDSIGVGAGVKAETNRLREEGHLPKGIRLIPWAASAKVLFPEARVIPRDKDSPLNKDFFANIKAQAWWQVARRFERTFRARNEGIEFDPGDLISIPSKMPNRMALQKELSQATMGTSTATGKLLINKTPEGTRSPNLADSFIMAYWPISSGALRYTAETIGK